MKELHIKGVGIERNSISLGRSKGFGTVGITVMRQLNTPAHATIELVQLLGSPMGLWNRGNYIWILHKWSAAVLPDAILFCVRLCLVGYTTLTYKKRGILGNKQNSYMGYYDLLKNGRL